MGRPAARVADPVAHPLPPVLTPGPGSHDVLIGGKPAWRGVGAMAAAALNAAKEASDKVIKAAEAATVAAAGSPGAPAAKAAEETAKATAATTMGATITSSAGGADIHQCATPLPLPPHGPGVIVDGSTGVFINGLPACRQGDTIVEAVGPPNKVAVGLPTVLIGEARFATAEAAAIFALQLANPGSVADNLEYGGWISQNSDGTFTYGPIVQGEPAGLTPPSKGPNDVADFHTHAAFDPLYDNENFSDDDKDTNRTDGVVGYLATPSGAIKKFDPAAPAASAETTLPDTAPP
jgi:uncharacterized Zn-binding protein involved in type VI secretion